MDFEQRKDATYIFITLLNRECLSRYPTAEFLANEKKTISELLNGYQDTATALNCGQILRECIKHQSLTKIIFQSPEFWMFFDFVESPVFDIAADTFQTFRELLTTNKTVVYDFLSENYEKFFDRYLKLLNSNNYVNRRQSLRLLSDLLLDRTNFNVMTRFVAVAENLKIIMILLRDKSRNIQFEAFHVFKVFVANPKKSKSVKDILTKNKEKISVFLENFQVDRKDDDQFHDERAFLISQIRQL